MSQAANFTHDPEFAERPWLGVAKWACTGRLLATETKRMKSIWGRGLRRHASEFFQSRLLQQFAQSGHRTVFSAGWQ